MTDPRVRNEKLLSRTEAAEQLGVIPYSIRNWARQGLLTEYDGRFNADEVDLLKHRIKNGEINRLYMRANKTAASGRFVPTEYLASSETRQAVNEIAGTVVSDDLEIEPVMFLLAVNLFIENKDVSIPGGSWKSGLDSAKFNRSSVEKFVKSWKADLEEALGRVSFETGDYLLNTRLPGERDFLGIVYQSLLREGNKSRAGSYYTPPDIVEDLLKDGAGPGTMFLDPCCGTGQFLLAAAEKIRDPSLLFGFDTDRIAVYIAGINLLLKFPGLNFTPSILNLDTLTNSHSWTGKFDLIATNPPWGARYTPEIKNRLKGLYPEAEAKDSFSWFLLASVRMLKAEGKLFLVLPESITNVKDHRGIREFLCSEMAINEAVILGKRFRKVMSPVITMKMTKTRPSDIRLSVRKGADRYEIEQSRFLFNRNFNFDLRISDGDMKIIRRLYHREHLTLKGRADWALGIVTGDNRRFVVEKAAGNNSPEDEEQITDRLEPIYRGSDILPFRLKEPSAFIEFRPDLFQQTAPEKYYRFKEKLIYRFISKRLVFALDEEGSLTLNSANILIPKIPDYPVRVILAFLNSTLFNYCFIKKFNSVKVLRGDLEELPFPVLQGKDRNAILDLTERVLLGKSSPEELDEFIFRLYDLGPSEIYEIKSIIPQGKPWT